MALTMILFITSCKKLVQIDEPVSSITTKGTFSTDVTATSAVVGIYSKLINTVGPAMFGNGGVTIYTGLCSDELTKAGIDGAPLQFYSNNLLPDNALLSGFLWAPAYFTVYQTNSCIEGLQNSENLTSGVKNQLIGECKFLRAFCYFYLTNLWGDIPMTLTGDWNKTYLLSRTPKSDLYSQIITDLKDAQTLLGNDYAIAGNQRIRANKFAATALLARVYLYQQDWTNAEIQSSAVINNSAYILDSNLNDVFLANSSEAILQLQPDATAPPWGVVEEFAITRPPFYFLTNSLVNAFDTLDKRKAAWTKSSTSSAGTILYPYKYKIAIGTPGNNPSEYYMLLRLGEQYLIRAEARARLNKISEAQSDLNVIRSRAGLPATTATDAGSLLLAIEHERQIELFAEWGHRWFDLIRTNRATTVLASLKGSSWQTTDQLFPIPSSERKNNPNLSQNPGYN